MAGQHQQEPVGGTRLLVPVGDSPAGQIVRGHLTLHSVTFQNATVELPHLPGEVGQDLMAILQLNLEGGVGEDEADGPLYFDCVFTHAGLKLPV